MNRYAPSTAVDQVIVVDGKTRAWQRDGDDTCLVTYQDGDAPGTCHPTDTIHETAAAAEDSDTARTR